MLKLKENNMYRRHLEAVLITIYSPLPNVGNRLQNYAAQEVLKKLGLEVTTICFEKSILSVPNKIKYFMQRLSGYRLPGDKVFWKLFIPKVCIFNAFNKRYIRTKCIRKIATIPEADYYVIGSDQVWNPVWYDEGTFKKEIYLLTFAEPKQKICLSPSFGLNDIPKEWEDWFRNNLLGFPNLAVREDAGAQIIKKLTGQNAEVTIDPTLMLNRTEWDKIAVPPQNIDCERKYILTYFLGGRSQEAEGDLKKFSHKIHADIYHLLDEENPDLYISGPSQFLYLLSHASLIITDSFHACVFSFLYGKPFLVYDRIGSVDMISRMETLFNKFDLKRKYINSGLPNDLMECNYEYGYHVLEKERKKLMDFLITSMNTNETK